MLVGCLVAAPVDERAPVALVSAAVLLVAGSTLHLWSKGCLEQNRRLVTAGPYRFTRNPFYLANGLIDAALCALIGQWWVALPYAVLWWLAYRETIRREEARLAALFPAEYAAYGAAVPRMLPNGRRFPREGVQGRFTLANPALAQGGEYARLVGVGVAAATIVACTWLRTKGFAVFAPEQAAGLALVVLVPVVWVGKLALGEKLRHPETRLIPFVRASRTSAGLALAAGAAGVGILLHPDLPRWPVALSALGSMLAAIEAAFGSPSDESRAPQTTHAPPATADRGITVRPLWPMWPRIALLAGLATVVLAFATTRR